MDGLVKSAPAPETDVSQNTSKLSYSTTDGLSISTPVGAIPIDVLTYFDVPLASHNDKELEKMQVIHRWARHESGSNATIGDLLERISQLDRELGYATDMMRKYDKVYNYCVLSMRIKDLDKRRDALRRRF